MDKSRRSFLMKASCAAAAAGCGFPLLGAASRVLEEGGEPAPPAAGGETQWGMIVDVEKCLDEKVRRACADACHREHNVPRIADPDGKVVAKEEVKWIWTEEYKHAFPDQTHQYTRDEPVLVLCNHCTKPPCVKVCPTQATWKRKDDGVVMMDMHRCIGCRYCIAACPYGSRSFNWRDPRPYIQEIRPEYPTRMMGVVEKCSFCSERIRAWKRRIEENPERIKEEPGPVPACVEAAGKAAGGEGALTFGNINDENSEVRRLLREKHAICRRPSIGTGPNVFYIV